MGYWIFLIKGNEVDFQKRISEGKWPIAEKTGNKNKIQKDDQVIFYLGGEGQKKFMGTCSLASEIIRNDDNFFVELKQVDIWKTPLFVPDIIDSLDFIPNKNWGSFFQGRIVWITKTDFDKILKNNSV